MQAAAAAGSERVERELARLCARESELAAQLPAVQAGRAELEHQRHVLNHFTHARDASGSADRVGRRLRALPDAGPTTTAEGVTRLRGARIRETAVRVLAGHNQPDAPVHYRDWFELLTAQGLMPAGKFPLATFLTQVGRSPLVQRTTTARMYLLDLEFPQRARAQLAAAQAETQELPPHATVDEIAAARERRATLSAQMQETERQLEEALRSLGEGAD
jgi:hypothetical protein